MTSASTRSTQRQRFLRRQLHPSVIIAILMALLGNVMVISAIKNNQRLLRGGLADEPFKELPSTWRLLAKRQTASAVVDLTSGPSNPEKLSNNLFSEFSTDTKNPTVQRVPKRDLFIQDRPLPSAAAAGLFFVTSTPRSVGGLRLQKATERTTTVSTTPRRTRPPPLYPDRNSIREFHPPSTVAGEGVGSVSAIRPYGKSASQRSSSSSTHLTTLTAAVLVLVIPFITSVTSVLSWPSDLR